MFETRDFERLNSATKYPSIPTFHKLGERGVLSGEHLEIPSGVPLIATEKVDGTNVRIVLHPDGDFLIGSREDFLYARGDRVGNPSMGIVEALREKAEYIRKLLFVGYITVFYGELYGHKIGAQSKQYTTRGEVGFRLFDIGEISPDDPILKEDPEKISQWRDSGGQVFLHESELEDIGTVLGIPRTPRLATLQEPPPSAPEDCHRWISGIFLDHGGKSQATLDEESPGKPEGIVLRSGDRSVIAKLRFEDYERHMRRKSGS